MNIYELAKQAGLHIATDVNWMPIISLEYAEKFAALVEAAARADEREECAKFVDHILKEGGGTYGDALRARRTT